MDSKERTLDNITSVVEALTQKIETLQAKVDELCKSTGECSQMSAAHKHLLSKNESKSNGTDFDTLRKKK
jgi:prefoldin subunit 5